MNEFVAKKVGEAHAFLSLVIDTYQQGTDGFTRAMSAEAVSTIITDLEELKTGLEDMSKQAGQIDTALAKSASTLSKITRARDEYVAERWDDTVELYEWFSFNAGAGTAHAHEVLGAAEALHHAELIAISKRVEAFFDQLLQEAKDYLHQEGARRAV